MSTPTVNKSGALCKSCGAWLPYENHGEHCGNYDASTPTVASRIEKEATPKTPTTPDDADRVAKEVMDAWSYEDELPKLSLLEKRYAQAIRDARKAGLEEAAKVVDVYRVTDKYAHAERGILVNIAGLIRAAAKEKP